VDGAGSTDVLVSSCGTWDGFSHSSLSVLSWDGVTDGGAPESFFAWAAGAFAAAPPIAALVVAVEGRVPVVRVDEASDARGARVVAGSAAGRVVRGRFAAAVVVEGASDWRDVGFPGDARVVVVAPGVLRTAEGFLFSSPEVTDDSSGSASDAVDLDVNPVRLTAAPGTGRVGGLFKLDPAALTRDVVLVVGLDALVGARAVLVDTVGRRAPTGAVPLDVVVGRRGGTPSLLAEAAFEAILRRRVDVGVEGAGSFLRCGLPA
jgi:hypothetical protein